ncbi:hypothetical protein Hdeb2414_s0025g00656851 [Helianthus debilis subsp. tardiflorus]
MSDQLSYTDYLKLTQRVIYLHPTETHLKPIFFLANHCNAAQYKPETRPTCFSFVTRRLGFILVSLDSY